MVFGVFCGSWNGCFGNSYGKVKVARMKQQNTVGGMNLPPVYGACLTVFFLKKLASID